MYRFYCGTSGQNGSPDVKTYLENPRLLFFNFFFFKIHYALVALGSI
jgi:hypothetical protein